MSYLCIMEAIDSQKKKQQSFYPKASDIVFDLGKLVFGGVLVGGLFETVANPFLLYTVGFIIFLLLMLLGYILFKLGVHQNKED